MSKRPRCNRDRRKRDVGVSRPLVLTDAPVNWICLTFTVGTDVIVLNDKVTEVIVRKRQGPVKTRSLTKPTSNILDLLGS